MSLTNEQYDRIMRSYEDQQLINRQESERRETEVYGKIPALREIDSEISMLSASSIKRLLDGEMTDSDSVTSKVKELINKKKNLIQEAGYEPGFLDPVYNCPDCKDTGYINNVPCHCFKQKALNEIFNQSNMSGILKDCDLNRFSLDYYRTDKVDTSSGKTERELATAALNSTKAFIDSFNTKSSAGNILYYGDTGMGKTFLSGCIAKYLLQNGFSVIYFSAVRLFDVLRAHSFDPNENKDSNYDQIFSSDLLIIDDLGTENATGFTLSALFTCINERIQRNKSTVISTNLGLEEFRDHYTERISSRIFSKYDLLKLCGDDIRLRLKIEKNAF